ncbi:4549_t:CDS:1, partial [Entrophospora sp. SA101]
SAAHAPEALDIVLGAGFNTRTISDCASQPALVGNTTSNTTSTSTSTATTTAANTPSTSIENNQYSSSTSSANLLTINSFIGLSITAVITIVSYSLNF